MNKVRVIFRSCVISAFFFLALVSVSIAGQVTMASYDFDGDGIDELVRTDEDADLQTNIRFYSRMDDSFFYKPTAVFKVSGRIVQVPEIADVNKDGNLEFFFSTGSDMGVIYFEPLTGEFVRTNDFSFSLQGAFDSDLEEKNDSVESDLSQNEAVSLTI